MRILYIGHNSDLYGASRSLLRLAGRWVGEGSPVRVVLPEPGPLVEALELAGAEVVVHPGLAVVDRSAIRGVSGVFRLGCRFVSSVVALIGLLRDWRPDVVHSNTSVLLSPGVAAFFCRIPHIWHIREFYAEFPLFWKFYRIYMGCFAKRIICISRAVQGQFEGSFAHRITRVVHNGIPKEEFAPVPPDSIREFRLKYGLGEQVVFANVGRIKLRRKGQETFVEAAGMMRESCPEALFMVVGSPFAGNESHLEQLRSRVVELGLDDRFVFAGDLKDIRTVFASIDVEVLTSAEPEPLGNVVLEAMAMSKPVIATRIGGPPEMVEEGVTGFLVAPSDAAALAAAMGTLAQDSGLRSRMGQAGRQRFVEHFEFECCFRGIRSVYEESTARPPGMVH